MSEDKLTITNIKHVDFVAHAIYFNPWIESTSKCIVKWTFKMNRMVRRGGEFYFGLVSKEKDVKDDFSDWTTEYIPNYAVIMKMVEFMKMEQQRNLWDNIWTFKKEIYTAELEFLGSSLPISLRLFSGKSLRICYVLLLVETQDLRLNSCQSQTWSYLQHQHYEFAHPQ